MGSYNFVTADKFGKNGWPFFGPLSWNLALVWTRFGPLAKSRSGHPDWGCNAKDLFRHSQCRCHTQEFSSSSLQIREAMSLKLLHLWRQSQKIRILQPKNIFRVQST